MPEKVSRWVGILGNHIVGLLILINKLTVELRPKTFEILEGNLNKFGNLWISIQQNGTSTYYYGVVS